jgi:hypothetical protein
MDENLSGPDHAEPRPGDLLDCIGSGLEILDLSEEGCISQAALFV